MPYIVIVAIAIHVLSAVFWAGTSFTLARTGGAGGVKLFWPQMGAALAAIVSGGYLFGQLHSSGFGATEVALAAGAAFALTAALVQAGMVIPALSSMRRGGGEELSILPRMTRAQRIAAPLLGLTIIAMAVSRYV